MQLIVKTLPVAAKQNAPRTYWKFRLKILFFESYFFLDLLLCTHLWAVISFPDSVGSAMNVEAC